MLAASTCKPEWVETLWTALPRLQPGLPLGSWKGRQFIPSAEIALNLMLHPRHFGPELDRQQALKYLKKDTILPEKARPGWQTMQYRGLPLGWLKVLKNRANNYYPKAWRIRMDL